MIACTRSMLSSRSSIALTVSKIAKGTTERLMLVYISFDMFTSQKMDKERNRTMGRTTFIFFLFCRRTRAMGEHFFINVG